mmetsp:Transcript_32522/g.52087  ORF Transcript_32522/g.52087 Transcript_32522/m.52087 type:complete len:152 (-) Transcript_32522:11-466(-)
MAFVKNLPKNGARFQNKNDSIYCQPYIAWHDTKPVGNEYCKVNGLNHLERSVILKNELEKLERDRQQSKNIKRKRLNHRKRKRPPLQSNNNAKPGVNTRKRRKCQLPVNDVMQSLLNQVGLESDPQTKQSKHQHRHKKRSLFDTLNDLPNN